MKKRNIGLLLSLALITLNLNSCGYSNKSVDVEINLDFIYRSTHKEDPNYCFPTPLSSMELDMMIQSKQDFVLYYHSAHCSLCKEVKPHYIKYLSQKDSPFNIYSYSVEEPGYAQLQQKYPSLLYETPTTAFIKNGEDVMDLSTSRYHRYSSFASAMNTYCKPTNIYTSTYSFQINSFLDNKEEYVLYLRNSNIAETYKYYSENIFNVMKNSKVPTLVIDINKIDQELKKAIFKRYAVDYTNDNDCFSVIKNSSGFKSYNYLSSQDSVDFQSNLNDINKKN